MNASGLRRVNEAPRWRMNRVNPNVVLGDPPAGGASPRAHDRGLAEMQQLLKVLQRPLDEQPEHGDPASLPPEWAPQPDVSLPS
jgi:serine/tyrosine/threonine adenylyltransferase